MTFYIHGLNLETRKKYGARLFCIEGAIGVLEEMVCGDIERIEKDEQDKKELLDYKILNNDDFNSIYDTVLNRINNEEKEKGSSDYRLMLDRVDRRLDDLTSSTRKEVRELEEEKDKECIGHHKNNRDYVKPVFHLPIFITDTMRVR